MIICMLVCILSATPDLASPNPPVIDQTTGDTWIRGSDTAIPTPTPAVNARQHRVVWDTTHGVYLTYYPNTRYSTLLNMLSDSGYTTDICGTGINTIDLDQYDVIVLCLATSWYSAYSQEEVDSLYGYYSRDHQRVILTGDMNFCENTYIVNADNTAFSYNLFDWLATSGGGILIFGDNPGCPNANINPVNDTFAMQSGVAGINPSDLYFSNFGAYTIFNGISQIYYRAAGSISAAAPAAVAAWTSVNEPTIGLLDQAPAVDETTRSRNPALIPRVTPNPFRTRTDIRLAITDYSEKITTLKIFDISGRLVKSFSLTDIGHQSSVIWRGEDDAGIIAPPGVYFIRVDGVAPVKTVKLQ